MNMTSHAQFTAPPAAEAVDIPNATVIYTALRRLTDQNMPDNLMDAIGDALDLTRQAIIDAPVLSSRDIGAKLRFAAILVEDDEHGHLLAEGDILQRCVDDLESFREAQHAAGIAALALISA